MVNNPQEYPQHGMMRIFTLTDGLISDKPKIIVGGQKIHRKTQTETKLRSSSMRKRSMEGSEIFSQQCFRVQPPRL